MKIEQFLIDYRIPYATEHKNIRDGWIGIDCPFCGTRDKYHLGYSLEENYFSCWQCGGHSHQSVVRRLLGVSTTQADKIIKQYGGKTKSRSEHRVRVGTNRFQLPPGNHSLKNNHKLYLERRNFHSEKLVQDWDITGTGPISKLDGINYGNRILAPIYWDKRLVSFQTRDITNLHQAKYMACPPEREIISHKSILYGNQEHWTRIGICVEGIFDVWRLGPKSFCTFGVKFTTEQLRVMVQNFDQLVILYDPEELAQAQADRLINRFTAFRGKQARKEILDCDPADLPQSEANYLMKHLTNSNQ